MRINRILGISLTVSISRIQYSKGHFLLEYCSHSPVSKKITRCMNQPDTLFTTVVLLPKFGFFLSNSL